MMFGPFHDRLPAEQMLHAFEQRANAAASLRRAPGGGPPSVKANFSCSVPIRNCDFGLTPCAIQSTSSSRRSIGVRST